MAITNNYTGFKIATAEEYAKADNDDTFGINLNRNLADLNAATELLVGPSTIKNSYSEGNINQFGASTRFSTNEQRLVQSLVRESIYANGITVRYMPRSSPYMDDVWNERPESVFSKGYQADMILVASTGFEGEGDVMTQYGVEFREEVVLTVAINRFKELDSEFKLNNTVEEYETYKRDRPMEGDLIVIPFGRSASNKEQYVPKVFEISRVTTYHDGAFFQLGDNYQYKIAARLFELSGEDLLFNPTVTNPKTGEIIMDSESGPIARARLSAEFVDSDLRTIDIAKDSDFHMDSWAKNHAIEERSQAHVLYDNKGNALKEKAKDIRHDYVAQRFGLPSVISNLDDI